MRSSLIALLIAAPLVGSLAAQTPQVDPPFKVDRTGIRWTLPFKAAQAKASREARLLLVKPIAFGTAPDGRW